MPLVNQDNNAQQQYVHTEDDHVEKTVEVDDPVEERLEDQDVEYILWTSSQIEQRVAALGRCISRDFAACSPFVLIGVATGAFMFLADLARKITLPVSVDFVRAQSYGNRTESSGVALISDDVKLDIKAKHVLVVEDIIDTGITLSHMVAFLSSKGAASVSVCALLDKVSRRKVPLQLSDGGRFYRGFECWSWSNDHRGERYPAPPAWESLESSVWV